jgi:hypothetical protein
MIRVADERPASAARLDPESAGWLGALAGTGPQREAALTRLHEMLLRICPGRERIRGPRHCGQRMNGRRNLDDFLRTDRGMWDAPRPRRYCTCTPSWWPRASETFSLVTARSVLGVGDGSWFRAAGRARAVAVRLELTGRARARLIPFGEVSLRCGVAHPVRVACRRSGSALGDSFDPRAQPGDAADCGEGPAGVDPVFVDRAGGADFVVEVLPVR